MTNNKDIAKFIFEAGHLKRQSRSGWILAGVENPESVAEHALVVAQIAFILSEMENAADPASQIDTEKAVTMAVFHDNCETRVMDQHKVAARYYSKKEGERQAAEEQALLLGDRSSRRVIEYFDECESRNTREGVIVKDADWLETAFQAKIYIDKGYDCWDWINNVEAALETRSAKELIKEMKEMKFTDWWKGLKKMTYTKL